MHRAVAQLKRRLATLGHEQRGRRKGRTIDVRRTMRASLETGGVPLRLRYRPKRPRRPEIYVLCDVSTSVTSASVFFLSVLHALHDSFRKLRSFVFIERISEVTEVFEHERDFREISERISSEGGVADVSGYTDYGRVWLEFLGEIADELDPRSTVIVLGDARTNGREPHADVFAQIAERAGRTFWLNPEPKLYWNYGDSVMAAYERYCDGAFECWTTSHLENFVNVVAGGVPASRLTLPVRLFHAIGNIRRTGRIVGAGLVSICTSPFQGGEMPPSYPVTFSVDYPERKLNRVSYDLPDLRRDPDRDRRSASCPAPNSLATREAGGAGFSGAVAGVSLVVLPARADAALQKEVPALVVRLEPRTDALRQPDRRLRRADGRRYPSTDEQQAVHLDFAYPDAERSSAGCRWSSGCSRSPTTSCSSSSTSASSSP